jgi:hypothetical protein
MEIFCEGIETSKVTVTLTLSVFATKSDRLTEEPDIGESKMAGKYPDELGATTFPEGSSSAASTPSLPGKLELGRLKVPNVNLMIELAAMFILNVN